MASQMRIGEGHSFRVFGYIVSEGIAGDPTRMENCGWHTPQKANSTMDHRTRHFHEGRINIATHLLICWAPWDAEHRPESLRREPSSARRTTEAGVC